jgi:ABC-2 type transport system ATP-binding protein
VIIIARGKLVATDSVANLTSRLRGSETVSVEVTGAGTDAAGVQQKLEAIAGVSRVSHRDGHDGLLSFIVESQVGQHIRPQLARTIVESGWNLNELHAVGLSLEEIFLELTGAPKQDITSAHATTISTAVSSAENAEAESAASDDPSAGHAGGEK